MNSQELKASLKTLGLSVAQLSHILSVSQRTIQSWLYAERNDSVPNTVGAFFKLLLQLPKEIRQEQINKLMGLTQVQSGMYLLSLNGENGKAVGVLMVHKGLVFGAVGNVKIDGRYSSNPDNPETLNVAVSVNVPPDVEIILPVSPRKQAYSFGVDFSFKVRQESDVRLDTIFGPVTAKITFLRDMPADI